MIQTSVTIGPNEPQTVVVYRHRWTDRGMAHDVVGIHVGPVSLSLPPALAEQVRDALAEQLAIASVAPIGGPGA